MTRYYQYLLLVFTLLFGCKISGEKESSPKNKETSWFYVTVKANSEEYQISSYDDTLIMKIFFNGKVDSIKKFLISPNDKDSLFEWTETLIQYKPEPKTFCTGYYGKLTLNIDYSEQVSSQVQYRSICEWQNLDSNTSKIYKLISKRLNVR